MKHFKKPDNSIWAFELDGSQDHLIAGDMVAVSDAQLAALRAPALADLISAAVRRIDADTDTIYAACIGNRATEYQAADQAAQAFKAAGYPAQVPGEVQSWAAAMNWSAQHAADDILATAAQWRSAQAQIRAARLARKEQVRDAGDAAGVEAALAAWAGFAASTRAALGLV
jgi:hypothetical protein